MKKLITVFLVFLTMIIVSACGGNESTDANQNEQPNQGEEDNKDDQGKVEVDKNLLSVEVTLPASMFEGEDIDTAINEAKAEGVNEVTKNSDGSVTYKMSKQTHKEMMKEMEEQQIAIIDELVSSGDFNSIKDVTYKNSFSEYTMIVDKSSYEGSFDGFAALSLGLSGMMYQLFNGAGSDDINVVIHVEDEVTGEVFNTINYPEDFGE